MWCIIGCEVLLRLPPLLAVADALPFGSVLLLPPLIQLGLHGLQGVPGVLLGRRRSMRGRRRWGAGGAGMTCCGGVVPAIWLCSRAR
jgi:hypothetical protein